MFVVEKEYTKNDIYNQLNVPLESQKGSWNTGYRSYNGDVFIFTNVGVAGRTGVNHGNYWDREKLIWLGKTTSHREQNLIKIMMSNEVNVHVFFRNDSSKVFTCKGLGRALTIEGDKPIKIVWAFINPNKKPFEQQKSIEGIDGIYRFFKEGASKNIEVNLYTRSLEARKKCIELKGCTCHICGFDFEKVYGLIGKGFIHVHHLNQLSGIKGEYIINPETDLIPVCPNCHLMLHKKTPSFSIFELKALMRNE